MEAKPPTEESWRILPGGRHLQRKSPPSGTWLVAGATLAAVVIATLMGVGLVRHGVFKQLASHVLASAPAPGPTPATHPSAGSGPPMPPRTAPGSNPGTGTAPAPPAGTSPGSGPSTPAPTTFDVTAGPGAGGGSFSLSGSWTRSASDGGNPGSTTYWTEQSSAQATWMLTGAGHSGTFSVSIYIPDRFAGALGRYQVHDAGGTFDVTLDQEELTGWYQVQHTFTANPNTQVSVTLTYAGPSSHPGDPSCPGGSCTELAANQVRFESS